MKLTTKLFKNDDYSGACLIGIKGDEYIEFYWLNDGDDMSSIEEQLAKKISKL